MLKETNMEGVRSTARSFMWLEPAPTPLFPIIIKHPYADHGFVTMPGESGELPTLVNIMEDKAAFSLWQKQFIEEHIDTLESPAPLQFLITKPYRMAFLKYAMPYMSQEDFSSYLASAWVSVEAPHNDPNFTHSQFVKLFKQAAPEHLMDEEDQELLAGLPDKVTVYRGITDYNASNIKGLSWTLRQSVAEWFAQRFSCNGYVYQAEVDKADIIALFTNRNESEVIVDPKTLQNITQIIDFSDENTIREREEKQMKLKQFETERDEILKDIDWSEFHTSPDFQCDQTDGVPTCLCAVFSKGKAWLEPTSSVTEDLSPEELEKFHTQCAAFGIRECNDPAEFNELLEKLGEDAVQTASIPEEDFELYEDTGMGGIQ